MKWLRQLLCGLHGHRDKLLEEWPDGSFRVQCMICEKTVDQGKPRWEQVACTTCGDKGRHLFPATFVFDEVSHPGTFCSMVCYDVFCKHIEQGVAL